MLRIKLKSIACLLLLAVATTTGLDDEWSWGIEAKESSDFSSHPGLEESSAHDGRALASGVSASLNIDTLPLADESDLFVYEVLPLAAEGDSLGVRSLPLTSEPLPLEPHGSASLSVVGDGDVVDGLIVAEEGDREGRFLGLGEKLCDFGIGINCAKKYPAPVKSHYLAPKPIITQGIYSRPAPVKPQLQYGPPKPAVTPQGSYGLPPPPVFPNRNYNVKATTQSPFSIGGILSVLKPFMPTSQPKAPPKVSKGGLLLPSYTAPNPNYAPLLPSYTPAIKPTYPAPTPSYVAPPSAYSPPRPTYAAPRPSYAAPAVHVHTKPAYTPIKPAYSAPKPAYTAPKPTYAAPNPAYITPKPSYDVVQPSYAAPPKRVYVEPKPAFVNPIPTVTVHTNPTVVEQHHHTHTHVYNDQTVHDGIYKSDHNGVLQSVHDSINQVNQYTSHRQDVSGISIHDSSHDIIQVAQPSVNQIVHQQPPSPSPSTPSIVPAVLVGGTNFRPGRIESGFQPSQSLLEPLFRPQQPTYREDCQCVTATFCSDQDVIGRSAPADLSNVIDARTRGTKILSNATDSEDSVTGFSSNEELPQQSSARQGKVLQIFNFTLPENEETTEEVIEEATEEPTEEVTENASEEPTEEVTEEATEEPTEEVTEVSVDEVLEEEEKSRVRRDTNTETEETEDTAAIYSDRQGRQLTGFTPGANGCGPNHVCCRRPVFKPRRQQFSCGRRNAAGLLGRVKTAHFVQGDTEFGEYPWQAAVLKRANGEMLYQCGGTLIDDRNVLTAAHCVDGLHPSELNVRLGEWDVSGETEFYNHVEIRAAGVYLHPEFYAGNLNNDIAVIRLEHFVDFSSNPHITPVCLPSKFSDFTNHRCHATGWGKDAFGNSGKFSQILKAVEVPVVETQQCQHSLQGTRLGASFSLHEGNICAGGEEGRDTCKGDGGGPLVCSGPDGSIQLAGLVSWGIGCGHTGVPGVYVKVSHYLNWIRDITRT